MSEVTDESARGIEAQITETLLSVRWPTGDAQGMPTKTVAKMLAAALVPLIATAQADALRDLADDIDPNGYGWALGGGQRFVDKVRARADRVEGGEL